MMTMVAQGFHTMDGSRLWEVQASMRLKVTQITPLFQIQRTHWGYAILEGCPK